MHETLSTISDFSLTATETFAPVETRDPSIIAEELLMLSRQKDIGLYVGKLVELDAELKPVDNLFWRVEDRTRTRLSQSLNMDEQALCRRLRVLKSGYEKIYPEENNPLTFVQHILPPKEILYQHRFVHVLPYDQSLRLIILDLLSRGYRTDVLAQKAQMAWTNNTHQVIETIYGYKSIKETITQLNRGENTTYRAISAVIPDWKTSLPLNLSDHVGGVYLSKEQVQLIQKYMSTKEANKKTLANIRTDMPKEVKTPKPPKLPKLPKEIHINVQQKSVKKIKQLMPHLRPAIEIARSVHNSERPKLTKEVIHAGISILQEWGDKIPDELECREIQQSIENRTGQSITSGSVYAIYTMMRIRQKRQTDTI